VNTMPPSAMQPFGEIAVALVSFFFVVLGAASIANPRRVQRGIVRFSRRFGSYVFQDYIESESYVLHVRVWGFFATFLGVVLLYGTFRGWIAPSS